MEFPFARCGYEFHWAVLWQRPQLDCLVDTGHGRGDVVDKAGRKNATLLRSAPEGEEADGANDDKLVQGRQAEEPL